MTGGTIEGCKPNPDIYSPQPSKGGGVFVKQGTFNMSGGKVSGNTADKGGGIYGAYYNDTVRGVIEISGGEVSGNTATSGGGIYSKYQLTVSGYAQIKNNAAPDGSGGGIIIPHNGRFYFTGGTVSGNTAKQGRGIYISTTAAGIDPMEMSGSATVTEGNDVFLDNDNWSSTHIIVTKALTNTPAATLTMKNDTNGYAPDRVVVEGTNGPEGYKLKTADIEKFPITPQTSQNWTTELDTVNNKLKLKTTP